MVCQQRWTHLKDVANRKFDMWTPGLACDEGCGGLAMWLLLIRTVSRVLLVQEKYFAKNDGPTWRMLRTRRWPRGLLDRSLAKVVADRHSCCCKPSLNSAPIDTAHAVCCKNVTLLSKSSSLTQPRTQHARTSPCTFYSEKPSVYNVRYNCVLQIFKKCIVPS